MKLILLPTVFIILTAGCTKSEITPAPSPSTAIIKNDENRTVSGPQLNCTIQSDNSTGQLIYTLQASVIDSAGIIMNAAWQYMDLSGGWNVLHTCSAEFRYSGTLPPFSELKFFVQDNLGYSAWYSWNGYSQGVYGN